MPGTPEASNIDKLGVKRPGEELKKDVPVKRVLVSDLIGTSEPLTPIIPGLMSEEGKKVLNRVLDSKGLKPSSRGTVFESSSGKESKKKDLSLR